MDKETLYDLRSLIALYPYFQTARLLMLQNLYILHDPSFDEELRKAAIYITDRKMIFRLIEAAHYKIKSATTDNSQAKNAPGADRTISLIDNFLDTIPATDEEEPKKKKRKPTAADAAIDYVSFLLDTESEDEESPETPLMKGQSLIDDFINNLADVSGKLGGVVEKADSAMAGINGFAEQLKRSEIDSLVLSVRSLSESIQNPEGTVGKLLNDGNVYESVDSLVNELNDLIQKIKENPKKYLKISVF